MIVCGGGGAFRQTFDVGVEKDDGRLGSPEFGADLCVVNQRTGKGTGRSAASLRPSGRDADLGRAFSPKIGDCARSRHLAFRDASACMIGRLREAEARLWRSTCVNGVGRSC